MDYIKIILIGVSIFIGAFVLYYLYYSYYINKKSRRMRLPDLKKFSITLGFLLLISGFFYIKISEYYDSKEEYTITVSNELSSVDMNKVLDTIKQKVKPDDSKLYATTSQQSIYLNNDTTIKGLTLNFYIYRNNEKVYFTINNKLYDNRNNRIKLRVTRISDIVENPNLITNEMCIDDLLIPLNNFNTEHMKDQIDMSDPYTEALIFFAGIPYDHNKYQNGNYDISNPQSFLINKDGSIVSVTNFDQLSGKNLTVYIAVTSERLDDGRHMTTTNFVRYFIEK